MRLTTWKYTMEAHHSCNPKNKFCFFIEILFFHWVARTPWTFLDDTHFLSFFICSLLFWVVGRHDNVSLFPTVTPGPLGQLYEWQSILFPVLGQGCCSCYKQHPCAWRQFMTHLAIEQALASLWLAWHSFSCAAHCTWDSASGVQSLLGLLWGMWTCTYVLCAHGRLSSLAVTYIYV